MGYFESLAEQGFQNNLPSRVLNVVESTFLRNEPMEVLLCRSFALQVEQF